MEDAIVAMVILFVVAAQLLIMYFVLRWVYYDAEERGQSGTLIAALVFFSGLWGILIWLVVRNGIGPKKVASYTTYQVAGSPDYDDIGQKQVCRECSTITKSDARYCPNCASPLW